MSLRSQLIAFVSCMLIAICSGFFFLTIDNASRYALDQMESNSTDSATVLALALSSQARTEDALFVESVVDALFDSGYYQSIEVAFDNGPTISRHAKLEVDDVPPWFLNMVTIESPVAVSPVMAGWVKSGQVTVKSHPGIAYSELWGSIIESFWWSILIFIVSSLTVVFGLKISLQPLRSIEQKAIAIADKDFRQIPFVPKARELRRVVLAINEMVVKVEFMLSAQYSRTERQRVGTFQDGVTGLGNKDAFLRDLNRMVSPDDETASSGVVVLCQVGGLEELNKTVGMQGGDEMLRRVATELEQAVSGNDGITCRLGGGLFGTLFVGASEAQQGALLDLIHSSVRSSLVAYGYDGRCSTGSTYYGGGQTVAALMQRAEQTLLENKGAALVTLEDARPTSQRIETDDSLHETNWRETLNEVIENEQFAPLFQPTISIDGGAVVHYEVLSRLKTDWNDSVEPGMFMPMAARVGLVSRLDRSIINYVLRRREASSPPITFNLSLDAINDDQFRAWLLKTLSAVEKRADVSFETSEETLAEAGDVGVRLANALRQIGVRFGLDRCGVTRVELDLLRELRADYNKLDGQLVRNLGQDRKRRDYLENLVSLRHAMDVKVYAEKVETESELELLKELGLDGAQGFCIAEPGPQPW